VVTMSRLSQCSTLARIAVLGLGRMMIVGFNSRCFTTADNPLLIGHNRPKQHHREHFSKPHTIEAVMSILRHDYIIYIV